MHYREDLRLHESGLGSVYWGAPNVAEYVDSHAYIDRRQFQSDSELASYLVGMSEVRYEEYRRAIRKCLSSEAFHGSNPGLLSKACCRGWACADASGPVSVGHRRSTRGQAGLWIGKPADDSSWGRREAAKRARMLWP